MSFTSNIQLDKPERGETSWAERLNSNFDKIDSAIGNQNSKETVNYQNLRFWPD